MALAAAPSSGPAGGTRPKMGVVHGITRRLIIVASTQTRRAAFCTLSGAKADGVVPPPISGSARRPKRRRRAEVGRRRLS